MGRHEAPAWVATFDQAVSEYVTGRARELIRQFDAGELDHRDFGVDVWCGAAAEILRELTRDA